MARYTGPVCRLCRREGLKLFLKGERCYTDKCAVEHRKGNPAPGQHGARRSKLSDYGVQLREKQKLRRIYGVLEAQFRRIVASAIQSREKTGEVLVQSLELRLDNVVYRMGLGLSRTAARQLVRHNHILVNSKRVNIPSMKLKIGDKITLVESSKNIPAILSAMEIAKRDGHGVPAWLKFDASISSGEVLAKPRRDDVTLPVKEQLVVEYYSK